MKAIMSTQSQCQHEKVKEKFNKKKEREVVKLFIPQAFYPKGDIQQKYTGDKKHCIL